MKKKIVCIFLSVFFAVCCLFGCAKKKTDEELVRERIDTFVTKYNDGDFEGVLECFDAKTRNTLQATFNVMGGLVGGLTGFSFDLGDLFTLGVAMMGGEVLAIQVSEVSIDGANAVATAQMGYTDIGEESIENVYIILVKEEEDWFIQDMQDEPPAGTETDDGTDNGETNNGGGTTSSYEMEKGEPFVDGRAWVKYSDNKDNEYLGFIDVTGRILYSEKLENQKTYNIGKGSALIVTSEDCKLIKLNGEVALTIDGTVEIKAYGGGYAWVYQNKSTITTLEHLYGVLDYQGKWCKPLENLQEEGLYNKIEYVGNGFVGETGRNDIEYSIYNGDNSVAITLNGVFSDWHIKFANGIALVPNNCHAKHLAAVQNGISIKITKTDQNGQISTQIYENIKDNYIIYQDGSVANIGNELWSLNYKLMFYEGRLIGQGSGQYYQITDYTETIPSTIQFTAYPISQIEDFVFNGDYGLVQLRGLDEEVYVTMIDKQGNELIEPIKGKDFDDVLLAPQGHIYYKQDGYYCIIDKNGKETKTDIDWFVYFDGEIGFVQNYWDILYYLKPNGEKLFESLHK